MKWFLSQLPRAARTRNSLETLTVPFTVPRLNIAQALTERMYDKKLPTNTPKSRGLMILEEI